MKPQEGHHIVSLLHSLILQGLLADWQQHLHAVPATLQYMQRAAMQAVHAKEAVLEARTKFPLSKSDQDIHKSDEPCLGSMVVRSSRWSTRSVWQSLLKCTRPTVGQRYAPIYGSTLHSCRVPAKSSATQINVQRI